MRVQQFSTSIDFPLYSTEANNRSGSNAALVIIGSSIYYPRCIDSDLLPFRRVLYLDLPHFTLPVNENSAARISLTYYSELIEKWRTELGLNKIVVLGHSHHGNVAFEYARRFPRSVCGVVMVCSPPANVHDTNLAQTDYWEKSASDERKRVLAERRAEFGDVDLAPFSLQEQYVLAYIADAPLYWRNMHFDASMFWQNMEFSMDGVNAFRRCFDNYRFEIDSLDRPILALSGAYDYAVPPMLWDGYTPDRKNLYLHTFENSGHTPSFEEPSEFERVIFDWMQYIGL